MSILFAIVLWVLAAWVLTEYEIHVAVLRPWQRSVYGVLAFLAGVALILRGMR